VREAAQEKETQDAYGWEQITSDELDRIKRLFDGLEDEPEQTVIGAATDELWHFVTRLRSDIRSFEWETLPDEEKERIERESAERRAIEAASRRRAKMGRMRGYRTCTYCGGAPGSRWQSGESPPTLAPYATAAPYYFFDGDGRHNWYREGWR
jgi:hypothetical protein